MRRAYSNGLGLGNVPEIFFLRCDRFFMLKKCNFTLIVKFRLVTFL